VWTSDSDAGYFETNEHHNEYTTEEEKKNKCGLQMWFKERFILNSEYNYNNPEINSILEIKEGRFPKLI